MQWRRYDSVERIATEDTMPWRRYDSVDDITTKVVTLNVEPNTLSISKGILSSRGCLSWTDVLSCKLYVCRNQIQVYFDNSDWHNSESAQFG